MKIIKAIFISIITCIIVNPLTSSLYVNTLGNNMGLELLGECSFIRNKKTQKMLSRNAEQFEFMKDLSEAGVLPWFLVYPLPFPPILTLYSFYYAVKSTYNGIIYLLFYKSRVETGEFDE